MKILDTLDILKQEILLKRTPSGRPITEKGVVVIESTLQDSDNYHIDTIQCKNCNIIVSSLLVPEGCVNCGSKDLD